MKSGQNTIFKVLSFLLAYPERKSPDMIEESRTWIEKSTLPSLTQSRLLDLLIWMNGQGELELQEEYVALFDRTPSLCLHLFEHVHGDSRDRGQALVDLLGVYRSVGLELATEEMPDYLPLFLEYLSLLPEEKTANELSGAVNVIAAIGARLKKRKSRYAAIFEALIDLSAKQPDDASVVEALREGSGEELSFEEMDAIWEEQFAFGDNTPNQTGESCPIAQNMLDRMSIGTSVNEEVKR